MKLSALVLKSCEGRHERKRLEPCDDLKDPAGVMPSQRQDELRVYTNQKLRLRLVHRDGTAQRIDYVVWFPQIFVHHGHAFFRNVPMERKKRKCAKIKNKTCSPHLHMASKYRLEYTLTKLA